MCYGDYPVRLERGYTQDGGPPMRDGWHGTDGRGSFEQRQREKEKI